LIEEISRPLDILVRSDILSPSRALPEKPEREVNAIVQRMIRMVMTTMSSTSVKPRRFFFMDLFFVRIWSGERE